MKKKSFYLCSLFAAALMFTGCSENEVTPYNQGSDKLGKLDMVFRLDDAGSESGTRAATTSSAIPPTSWSSINNLRVVMYDGSGVIKLAKTVTKPANGNAVANFTNVLTGNYTIVAMANVQSASDAIWTYGTGIPAATAQTPWTDADMVGKNIDDLILKHKNATMPTFAATDLAGKQIVSSPSEIFLGYATTTISDGVTSAATLALKREVSMMRVRLDVSHANVAKVDWTKSAGVFVQRLPKEMKLSSGVAGGASTTSIDTHIQFASGFLGAMPSGYEGIMFTDNYTLFNDVIVFANNGDRTVDADANAAASQKYFIIITGEAMEGHRDKAGNLVPAGNHVAWFAQVDGNFAPNRIREVNIKVTTGGDTVIPPIPLTYGNIDITVSAPTPWNDNILQEDKEL